MKERSQRTLRIRHRKYEGYVYVASWDAKLTPAVPLPYFYMTILCSTLCSPSLSLSISLFPIFFLPLSADLVRNIFLDYFLGARIERFALCVCVCVPRQGADFWYQHDGIRCGLPSLLLPSPTHLAAWEVIKRFVIFIQVDKIINSDGVFFFCCIVRQTVSNYLAHSLE